MSRSMNSEWKKVESIYGYQRRRHLCFDPARLADNFQKFSLQFPSPKNVVQVVEEDFSVQNALTMLKSRDTSVPFSSQDYK